MRIITLEIDVQVTYVSCMANAKNTPESWIELGLRSLAETGPEALKAEALARKMGSSKGSFYWHFKDVPHFQRALLEHWAEDATARLAGLDTDPSALPASRLHGIARYQLTDVDKAVRGWANFSAEAAQAVQNVDTQILEVLTEELRRLGASHPHFPNLILAAMLKSAPEDSHTATLVDLLLILK